jgi:hypothetical protein
VTEGGGRVEWYRRGPLDDASADRLRDLVDQLLPHLQRQQRRGKDVPRFRD